MVTQPMLTMFDNPCHEEIFPNIQYKHRLVQLEANSSLIKLKKAVTDYNMQSYTINC